jgi:hypothetical protein
MGFDYLFEKIKLIALCLRIFENGDNMCILQQVREKENSDFSLPWHNLL